MMAMENVDLQRSAYSRRRLLATLGLPNSGRGVPSNRTCRQNADGIATPSREEMKKATGLVAEAAHKETRYEYFGNTGARIICY